MIDDQDRLIQIDEGFRRFAEENSWSGTDSCLGRVIWDFVAGEEPKKLQRMLLRRIRGPAGAVELPFRCDAPGARREMDIRIAPSSAGRLVMFKARLRHEEPREFQPLLDAEAERTEETLEMCGWCDRFRVEGEWVEVEVAAKRLRLFQRRELPAISHGICPVCSEMLLAA